MHPSTSLRVTGDFVVFLRLPFSSTLLLFSLFLLVEDRKRRFLCMGERVPLLLSVVLSMIVEEEKEEESRRRRRLLIQRNDSSSRASLLSWVC